MALTLTIAGTDKTLLLRGGTLSISDALNSRNTCQFTLVDYSGTYRPAEGATVVITEDAMVRFAGTIEDIIEVNPDGLAALKYDIACVDYNQIADRHLVARVYENQTLGVIVTDIVSQDLAGEGVTTAGVETGPVITKAVFNYSTASAAFDELSGLTGYSWNIDYNKDLSFFSRETYQAPFALTDTSGNYFNMRVKRTRGTYRNRQLLRAGTDLTDARTEEFKGDGKTKAFMLTYPAGKVPTSVQVNGASKTLGIRGIETGKDFYWNKGDSAITQDDGATALAGTDTLSITYQGLFPIIISSQDDAEISARAAAEGGSGLYEAIEDDGNIDKRDLAIEKADGLLRRFGTIPRIVEYATDTAGLAAGQLITINITKHNLSGQFLIESVGVRDVGIKLRYQVKALDGEALGGWIEFFQRLAQSTRTFVIRENEVLGLLRRFSDAIALTDTLTTATAAPLRFEVGAMFYSDAGQVAEVLVGPPPVPLYCLGSITGTQGSSYWSWRGWVATTDKALKLQKIGFRQHPTKPSGDVRIAVVRLDASNVIQEIYGQYNWAPENMGPSGQYYDNWYVLPALVDIPGNTRIAILGAASGATTWAAVTDGKAPGASNGELTVFGRIESSLGHSSYPLTTGGTVTVTTSGTPTANTPGQYGQLLAFGELL